jgi:hypothetical protein
VAFATDFYGGRIGGATPEDTAQTVFRDIMADLAEEFSLHLLEKSLNEEAKKRAPSNTIIQLPHNPHPSKIWKLVVKLQTSSATARD